MIKGLQGGEREWALTRGLLWGLLAPRVEELAGGRVGAWCEDSAGRVIAGSFASHDVRVGREPFEAVSALCGDDWFGLLVEDG